MRFAAHTPHESDAVAGLKVPLAYAADGEVVTPDEATKGSEYRCPACHDLLILRAGEHKKRHFAHRASDTCTQETIIHICAKEAIRRSVVRWKLGRASPPAVVRTCRVCEDDVDQPLPSLVDTAVLEYRCAEGYVVDVALLASEEIRAAVEVRVAHAVDDDKASELSVPFVEVDGLEAIASPARLRPIVDRFHSFTCRRCKEAYRRFQSRTRQIAIQSKAMLPNEFYRYTPWVCWNCNSDILVYDWPKRFYGRMPERKPFPSTIKYRTTNSSEGCACWLNTCPYCDATQGDWFLHSIPGGPFDEFSCGGAADDEYEDDLRKLASASHCLEGWPTFDN